jgi:hypothetical protein
MSQDHRLLTNAIDDGGGPIQPPPPPVTYRILQEDSFLILTETGFPLRKETNT